MGITSEEKVATFEKELELIFDTKVREFARLCLIAAPDYFYLDCPASSSGKYHPISELGPDGTMLHTKKVFTVAYELCRGLTCEHDRDVILASCLIHDLVKQGWKKTGHTQKNHPKLAAELVDQVQADTQMLDEEAYSTMRCCCGYHYGPWSSGEWQKPLNSYTFSELTVYLSDYIASKRCIEVDIRRG